ncbi:hypothetical protein, partial [Nocardiopsis sp. LOL_012]|uniref:hypothetical protein n=1 Tax=Nocardiopsis sp. LOL_012 TaxID=3345409 RepID=UPI003A8AFECE
LPLHPALRNAWPHLHEQITAGPVQDPGSVPGSLGPDGFRRFATDAQATRYAEQFLNAPERNPHAFANLPEEQRETVREYIGGNLLFEDLERKLDLVDQALDRPLPEPLIAYGRFIFPQNDNENFFERYSAYLFKDSAPAAPFALDFELRRSTEEPLFGAELVLSLPAGSRGLWIGEISGNSGYRNLLLPRGTRYVINGFTGNDTWQRFNAEVLPPGTATSTPGVPDTAPGVRAPDGTRRFTDDAEAARYGAQVLDDPDRNPHAFANLPEEQRKAVDAYTLTSMVFNHVLQLAQDERISAYLQEQRADVGPGLALFGLGSDGHFPTLDELKEAERPLPSWQQPLVNSILNAPDPERTRRRWLDRSGMRGRLTDVFGHFPDADDIRRIVPVLDQAFGPRTLPETVFTRRSL